MMAGLCTPGDGPFGPVLVLVRLTVYLTPVGSSGRGRIVHGAPNWGVGTARDPVEPAGVSGSELRRTGSSRIGRPLDNDESMAVSKSINMNRH